MIPSGVDSVRRRIRNILDRRPGAEHLDLAREAVELQGLARQAVAEGNAVRAQIVGSIAREFEDRALGLRPQAA